MPGGCGPAARTFPHMASATPHCETPHFGSFAATSLKVRIASSNQNECSSATPRFTCGLTASAQVFGKVTLPSRSAGAPWPAWSWARATPLVARVRLQTPSSTVSFVRIARILRLTHCAISRSPAFARWRGGVMAHCARRALTCRARLIDVYASIVPCQDLIRLHLRAHRKPLLTLATCCLCRAHARTSGRLSRLVTRLYDAELRESDLEVTQFGVLSALDQARRGHARPARPWVRHGQHDDDRVVAVLERRGWVARRAGQTGAIGTIRSRPKGASSSMRHAQGGGAPRSA